MRLAALLTAAAAAAWAGNVALPGSGRAALEFNASQIGSVVVVGLAGPNGAGVAVDAASGRPLRSCPMPAGAAALLQSAPFANVVPLFSTAGAVSACRVVLDANTGQAGVQEFANGATLNLVYCSMSSAGAASCDLGTSAASPGSYVEQTAARHAGAYPNRILKVTLDDRTNGGDPVGDNNDLVMTIRNEAAGSSLSAIAPMDEDGDGLWDDWETEGADLDADGVVDVNLPAMGALKRRRNVFVYVDYMDCAVAGGDCQAPGDHSHRPKAAAIAKVTQAYADAYGADVVFNGFVFVEQPSFNPDGTRGVALTVEIAPSGFTHAQTMHLGACGAAPPGAADFDARKAAGFGANPKRFTHRYAIFAHGQAATGGPTGCGETPGNDFLVTLGNVGGAAIDKDGDGTTDDNRTGTILEQAGTFMHELGHNLGLRHGGGDSLNNKPNYISVMNYTFQLSGIPQASGAPVLDYSGTVGVPIVESEPYLEGISPIFAWPGWRAANPGRTDQTRVTCPNYSTRTGPAIFGVADYNCSGVQENDYVTFPDINGDRECIRPGADGVLQTAVAGSDQRVGQFIHDGADRTCDSVAAGDDVQMRAPGHVQPKNLNGYSDWSNLRFDSYALPEYQDGEHAGAASPVELDVATYERRHAPDPGVSITAAPAGAAVAFTVRTMNHSTPPANGVQTTVNVPGPMTVSGCSATGGGTCSGSGGSRQIAVNPLGGAQFFDATVTAAAPCSGSNPPLVTVTVSVASATPDINADNNAASLSYPSCVAQALPVAITYGAPRRNLTTGLYAQPVTVRNTGTQPLSGPFSLTVEDLTAGVTLTGPAPVGTTAYSLPAGRPFVNLGAGSLAPGAGATAVLTFQNPSGAAYRFTSRLLGAGAR